LNVFGAMYMGVVNIGAFNDLLIIPFSTVERTVMYREKFAGMYSSWSYSFAQVRSISQVHKRSKIYTESTNIQFSSHVYRLPLRFPMYLSKCYCIR
jgi:hypothetical protein